MRSTFVIIAILAVIGCKSKAHVSKKDMLLAAPHAAAPRSAVYKPKKGKAVVPKAPVATPTKEEVAKRIARNADDFAPKPPSPPWYKQLFKPTDHYHIGYDGEHVTIDRCDVDEAKKEQDEEDQQVSDWIAGGVVKPGSGKDYELPPEEREFLRSRGAGKSNNQGGGSNCHW